MNRSDTGNWGVTTTIGNYGSDDYEQDIFYAYTKKDAMEYIKELMDKRSK